MRLSVLAQYALPHRALSRLVYWATRWTWAPWKNFLIGRVVKAYNVDMRQAAQPDPFAYPSFNAFFTRALKPGARPITKDERVIACPADGRISQFGSIRDGRIFQAKGQDFSAAELLGNEAAAEPYENGRFITVYLSPRDYHRVHAPLAGTLRETLHIPGRLFSVAPFAVEAVPRLFARNERLVCHFKGAHGPFVVVMVGAMLVSGVETVWSGVEIPPYASAVVRKDWRGKDIRLERGAELARFNMGSTVIVLLPSETAKFDPELSVQMSVEMGMSIGRTSR
ncbi:MAG TPA: archaetidylserine decarboxylase [Rudaea sp.]|nr:archaetidylserine decarboxylase [Rudaea sp.]